MILLHVHYLFFHDVINFRVRLFFFNSMFMLIERILTEIPISLIDFTLWISTCSYLRFCLFIERIIMLGLLLFFALNYLSSAFC